MTMRITITNEDQTRNARVRVRDLATNEQGAHTGACTETEVRVIPPGGSTAVYIYKDRDVTVEEVQEG